jgi:hypothetical protein
MAGGTGYNANNEAFHSDRAFVYDVVKDKSVFSKIASTI